MSYHLDNEQKLIEVIFANRNKEYGAYQLRSNYGITVFKSLAFMLSGFSVVIFIGYILTRTEATLPDVPNPFIDDPQVYVVPFGQPQPPPEPKPAQAIPPAASSNDNSSTGKPVIVDDTETVSATTFTASAQNTNTLPGITDGTGVGTGSNTTGTGSAVTTNTESAIKRPFEVDSEPQFEGGLKALNRFIATHIKYPERALEEGVEGTVYVRFIVDENGKVGEVTLQNNKGYGLDEEAARVVALIPNFKQPAMAKGHPVKMYYQIPIKFHIR